MARVSTTAHPHSRRENVRWVMTAQYVNGSSPLMRGKRCRAGLDERVDRLIPTHAGKRFTGCESLGSFGLIPTHAGKTWCASARPQRSRAHPRSRRENSGCLHLISHVPGSSPHTRGNMNGQLGNLVGPGSSLLTPGKRATSRQPFDASRAHPR